MTKRVLGDGATCCGEDCELCSDTVLTFIPAIEVEPTEDLDPFDEEDDE